MGLHIIESLKQIVVLVCWLAAFVWGPVVYAQDLNALKAGVVKITAAPSAYTDRSTRGVINRCRAAASAA